MKLMKTLYIHDDWIRTLLLLPNDRTEGSGNYVSYRIASGSEDGTIKIWGQN